MPQARPDAAPSPKAPAKEDSSIFRLPETWEEFEEGIALGLGNLVEGAADVPGLVLDPINTMVGRGLGYDGYTADFGKTVRESLGLPEDKSLSGDIVRGAAGGIGGAGLSRLAAKAATSSLAQKALAELGSTPVRDAVGGAGAALGAGIAEREGAPMPLQVAAALAGGAGSVLGLEKAAASGAKVLDGPVGDRVFLRVPKSPPASVRECCNEDSCKP